MGCLLTALAGLLALAIPASIARSSLVGALVLIAVFAVIGAAAMVQVRRRRSGERVSTSAAVLRVGALAVGYAAVVVVIHYAA